MTTLYKPVLIDSVEQAEALPVGTIAHSRLDSPELADVGYKTDSGWVLLHGHGSVWADAEVVGDFALVPIEAEEVIGTEFRHQITDKSYDIHVMRSTDMDNARWQVENNPKSATGRIMRQYRTPWEEA